MSFRLKRVDATDPAVWAAIVVMDAACFHKDEAPALSDNGGTWWICYAGAEPAGYCCIKSKKPLIAYIPRVGVLVKHRGNGLQKRMMRRAIEHARVLGFMEVVSDTANNLPSANSFISCGFRLFEPREKWGLPEALYWRKVLKQ